MKLYVLIFQMCKEELQMCVYIYKAKIDEYYNKIILFPKKSVEFIV